MVDHPPWSARAARGLPWQEAGQEAWPAVGGNPGSVEPLGVVLRSELASARLEDLEVLRPGLDHLQEARPSGDPGS